MTKYLITAIVPFTMVVEANTVEHATTKGLLLIENNALMIVPTEDGRPSLATITEVLEIKETEDDEQ